jgi:hypothetical protein
MHDGQVVDKVQIARLRGDFKLRGNRNLFNCIKSFALDGS